MQGCTDLVTYSESRSYIQNFTFIYTVTTIFMTFRRSNEGTGHFYKSWKFKLQGEITENTTEKNA